MFRSLRLDTESHDAVMSLAAPVSSFSKIHVERHKRIAILCCPLEERLVVAFAQAHLRGVEHRVPILSKRSGDFNAKVLVEEESMHQSLR